MMLIMATFPLLFGQFGGMNSVLPPSPELPSGQSIGKELSISLDNEASVSYPNVLKQSVLPGFNGKISRSKLETYLKKSASQVGMHIARFDSRLYNNQLNMIGRLKPKFLGRVVYIWEAAFYDELKSGTFWTKAKKIAQDIHRKDSDIILQAAIFEFVEPIITGKGIQIPKTVWEKFSNSSWSSNAKFSHSQITYDNVGEDLENTPDLNKPQAQMWFYYLATKYIDAGYEAIHFGQFSIMNNNDSQNRAWWDMLTKVRNYAKTRARRKLVICDAHLGTDRPYFGGGNQLLFDIHSATSNVLEGGKIPGVNLDSEWKDNDLRIGYIDEVKTNFGGKAANNWGWSSNDLKKLPLLVELDHGGPVECNNLLGAKTTNSTQCNGINVGFKTWGWDEFTWYSLQNPNYRDHFLFYMADRVNKLEKNAFFQVPFRREAKPTHKNTFPKWFWYSADNSDGKQEEVIKAIWNGNPANREVDFCSITTELSDLTFNRGWRTNKHIRVMGDATGNRKSDIIAFGDGGVFVSKSSSSNGNSRFSSPQYWGNGFLGYNGSQYYGGWRLDSHERYAADINGDGKTDVVGFGDDYVMAATSNGSKFTTYKSWTTQLTNARGFTLNKHLRLLADVDGEYGADAIGFGNAGVYVGLSDRYSFRSTVYSPNYFGYNGRQPNGGWRVDKHVRTVGKVGKINSNESHQCYDLVGFGDKGVLVGLSRGNGQFKFSTWINKFGNNHGYSPSPSDYDPIRLVGDVDGDGYDDVVGFGKKGVEVGISNGSNKFIYKGYWIHNFGYENYAGGWKKIHPRFLADVNGDGKKDIVGFGNSGVLVSLSTGHTFMEPQTFPNFGAQNNAGGWSIDKHVRTLADVDNDGREEIVGFGNRSVYIMNCGGSSETFRLVDETPQNELIPSENSIQVFPNPFSKHTQFKIGLIEPSELYIKIFDGLGRLVDSPVEGKGYSEGIHTLKWSREGLPNGVYFLIFEINGSVIHEILHLN